MWDSIKKHWSVAKEAYLLEKDRAVQQLPIHHKDFLPAALSILEKPASPAGHFTLWCIVLLFTIALGWAFIGKIDVVAVAPGKIVTHGQTKIVQTFEPGIVAAIYVENGSRVKQGQILVELDSTTSTADVASLRMQYQASQVSRARNAWLFEVLVDTPKTIPASLAFPESIDVEVARVQTLLAESQINEYRAVQSAYLQQLEEKKSELSVVGKELNKLMETLPLLEEQTQGMLLLSKDGVAPRFQYLEYEERLITRRKDLIIGQDRVLQTQAGIRSLEKQREQHTQEFRKELAVELAKATDTLVGIEQELKKAEQTHSLQRIRAPVDGVVQQLVIHTVGGVVKPGDSLMAVVPAVRELQVEATILNKDIGFVSEGQQVEVKLEAFPFTKYGVIDGVIESIDLDAVQDEHLGLVYPARINIESRTMRVDEKDIPLTPGMALSAEVKIGKRRLIEFMLAPLLRYKDESLRER